MPQVASDTAAIGQPRPAAAVPAAKEIVARARALIPTLAARAIEGERERRLPKATIADLHRAGLFRVLQPRRWGGYEMDILTYFEVQMALAEGDMSVAWVYGVVGIHPWLIALYDDRAQRDIWGEDNTTLVCSSLMPVGTATPANGGFRLSGRWKYASGCDHCAWAFLGGAPPGGAPEERRIFLVPRSDYEIVDTWHVSGLKGTGSNDIVIKDAFVPSYRTLTFADNFRGVAPGLAVNASPLYRLPFGQVFFRGVSTGGIGALQGMLNAYIGYAKARITRLSGAPASEDPLIQQTCAEIACAIDEMKTILTRNFRILEGYAARGEMPPLKLRMEYKFHNAWVAERCSLLAARLFKATGSMGIFAEQPYGRILADINAGRSHISNQFEANAKSFGATLFGIEETKDMVL
jgi:3-hydroxy-9,10-secoandrosta-1,3,5(10)-triene-9,17-dione monooxygenase